MINIDNKDNCCGCGACVQKCPMQSVSLHEDNKGFLYPQINNDTCIDCGICEKVCPFIHPYDKGKPIQTLAAINKNEIIRMESSSGGIFTLLAEKVIYEGGVVFGARFDEDWQVALDYSETIEGLSEFRGSKYVQARTGDTFKQCEQFLKDGRKVLFSGTPCQISGLKHFLRKEYETLYTVEIFCHGVPSPKIWGDYIHDKSHIISEIKFRDKSEGWNKFHFVLKCKKQDKQNPSAANISVISERFGSNRYMHAFLKNLSLRPSCFSCKAKSGSSGCDISLGDFWGYSRYHEDDDKGTSAILTYTEKGIRLLKDIDAGIIREEYNHVLASNPAIEHSVPMPKAYDLFWEVYTEKQLDGVDYALSQYPPTFVERLIYFIKYRVLRFKE